MNLLQTSLATATISINSTQTVQKVPVRFDNYLLANLTVLNYTPYFKKHISRIFYNNIGLINKNFHTIEKTITKNSYMINPNIDTIPVLQLYSMLLCSFETKVKDESSLMAQAIPDNLEEFKFMYSLQLNEEAKGMLSQINKIMDSVKNDLLSTSPSSTKCTLANSIAFVIIKTLVRNYSMVMCEKVNTYLANCFVFSQLNTKYKLYEILEQNNRGTFDTYLDSFKSKYMTKKNKFTIIDEDESLTQSFVDMLCEEVLGTEDVPDKFQNHRMLCESIFATYNLNLEPICDSSTFDLLSTIEGFTCIMDLDIPSLVSKFDEPTLNNSIVALHNISPEFDEYTCRKYLPVLIIMFTLVNKFKEVNTLNINGFLSNLKLMCETKLNSSKMEQTIKEQSDCISDLKNKLHQLTINSNRNTSSNSKTVKRLQSELTKQKADYKKQLDKINDELEDLSYRHKTNLSYIEDLEKANERLKKQLSSLIDNQPQEKKIYNENILLIGNPASFKRLETLHSRFPNLVLFDGSQVNTKFTIGYASKFDLILFQWDMLSHTAKKFTDIASKANKQFHYVKWNSNSIFEDTLIELCENINEGE